jgi:hypothetical protein
MNGRCAFFRVVPSSRNRAALAAVGKKARVALVCADTESVSDLLQRLNVALGKAARENIVIDEVLPEIKRRR